MTTTIITGGDLTLTINAIDRSAQITSAILSTESTRDTYQLIGGTKAYKVTNQNSTLACEILLDWSSGTSDFADALWTAATTAPDTAISFILASNGQSFTGSLLPEVPNVGSAGSDVQTWSVTFQVVDTPTKS